MNTLIRIKNTNAKTFLQGQLTCDVNKINELRASLGGYCELKGRLIASFRLFILQQDYYLALPADIANNCTKELQKYGMFSKVVIERGSDMNLLPIIVGDSEFNQALQEILSLAELPVTPNDVIQAASFCIIRCHGEQARYLIAGATNDISSITTKLTQAKLIASDNQWQLAEINAGIPTITADTIAQFTPHEVNLPRLDAVSFNKGCYRGQEIVARMHYRGKLKQHMYRASLNGDQTLALHPGAALHTAEEKNTGYVVNCTFDNKTNQWQLLVTVKDETKENDGVFYQGQKLEFGNLPYTIQD